MRFLKTYVWSVTLCRCEKLNVGKGEKCQTEALEMWHYSRLMLVS